MGRKQTGMQKNVYRALICAVAASGLTMAGSVSAFAAPATAPVVTIATKSVFKPVTHDVFVMYKGGKAANVTISGTVSGATTGDVATLYAQSFPFTSAPAPVAGQTVTLNPTDTNPIPYSFTATPHLATKYTVEVFDSTPTFLSQSPTKTVYVVTNQPFTGLKRCGRPVCHETIHVDTLLPASAYKLESAKRWFFYFKVKLDPVIVPPAPRFLFLHRATITRVRRISRTEFERTISWSFRIGNNGFNFNFSFCSKDTEAKDGLNLPGRHGCGATKVLARQYLG